MRSAARKKDRDEDECQRKHQRRREEDLRLEERLRGEQQTEPYAEWAASELALEELQHDERDQRNEEHGGRLDVGERAAEHVGREPEEVPADERRPGRVRHATAEEERRPGGERRHQQG